MRCDPPMILSREDHIALNVFQRLVPADEKKRKTILVRTCRYLSVVAGILPERNDLVVEESPVIIDKGDVEMVVEFLFLLLFFFLSTAGPDCFFVLLLLLLFLGLLLFLLLLLFHLAGFKNRLLGFQAGRQDHQGGKQGQVKMPFHKGLPSRLFGENSIVSEKGQGRGFYEKNMFVYFWNRLILKIQDIR